MSAVEFVVPDGIHDPRRPSGGNTYDRHAIRELRALGVSTRLHSVPGRWPHADPTSLDALAALLAVLPDDAVVLVDGLVASAAPDVLVPQADRLRLVVLVHMPLGHRPRDGAAGDVRRRERAVLDAAAAVVTTSAWTRNRLLRLYGLPIDRLHIAEPGVEAAELATGTATGTALLCVAAVTFEKGHDVLLDALATAVAVPWRCICVGSLERDPPFVGGLRRRSIAGGSLGDRVRFIGPRTGVDLHRVYDAADLVVLPSRAETFGMVVTEALARGLPVLAAGVGGVSEALGYGADRVRPGLLVPPEDPTAFGAGLAAWLGDAGLRDRLRQAARERRACLSGWSTTASVLARILAGVSR